MKVLPGLFPATLLGLLLLSVRVATAVEIKHVATTPLIPLYEKVGDQAVLNCEMQFENTGLPLGLVSWKVRKSYGDGTHQDVQGQRVKFWQNLVLRTINKTDTCGGGLAKNATCMTDTFAGYYADNQWVPGQERIPKNSHIIFFLAITDFPANKPPHNLTVTLKFEQQYTNAMKELSVTLVPKMYQLKNTYIFPTGWGDSVNLPAGQEWFIGHSHEVGTPHRRAHNWWDGKANPLLFNQRYAHDLLIRDAKGETHRPFPEPGIRAVEHYYAWGQKVYAMSSGTVTAVYKNAIDGWYAGAPRPAGEPGAGNYVIIDHGDGESSGYAHLQKGSIPFKKGDLVKVGDVIGKIGQTGASSEPHLHFALAPKNIYERHDGLPIYFLNIELKRDKVDGAFQKWMTGIPSGSAIKVKPISFKF